MWAVEWYLCCCSVCGLLYCKWAVVVYVGSCMVCELSYGVWAVEWYAGCCMVYGLLLFDREMPVILSSLWSSFPGPNGHQFCVKYRSHMALQV